MPIPLAVFPAVVAGAKTLYTAFNKPKLQEPRYLLESLDKQIAETGSDVVNKTLMSNLTSTAKSLGAKMYQQQQRGLTAMSGRGELSEGQKARALLDLGTQVQSTVGEQAQGAVLSQADANAQSKARMDEARLNVARLKDEARQRLNMETQQWQNELAGGVLDTVTTGFNTIMQGIENKNLQNTLTQFLKDTGKTNLTELDDDQLRGLLTRLTMAKMGLSSAPATPAPAQELSAPAPTQPTPAPQQPAPLMQAPQTAPVATPITEPTPAPAVEVTKGTGKTYAEWQKSINTGKYTAQDIALRNIESYRERGFWINSKGQTIKTPPDGYANYYGGQ